MNSQTSRVTEIVCPPDLVAKTFYLGYRSDRYKGGGDRCYHRTHTARKRNAIEAHARWLP